MRAGANTNAKDTMGRDLNRYAHFSRDEVSELLLSIHIQPNRHYKAPHNWVYFNDDCQTPACHPDSPHPEKLILISNRHEDKQLIEMIKNEAKAENDMKLYSHISRQTQQVLVDPKCTTVLDQCMAGQTEILKLLPATQPEVTVPTAALSKSAKRRPKREAIKLAQPHLFASAVTVTAPATLPEHSPSSIKGPVQS
jgi:hypothetical protein